MKRLLHHLAHLLHLNSGTVESRRTGDYGFVIYFQCAGCEWEDGHDYYRFSASEKREVAMWDKFTKEKS